MEIDFSSLGKSIAQLETSLSYASAELAKTDPGLFGQVRNSVIQCFEFSYELSHKMLKRFLEESTANREEIDWSSFQSLIRIGNEKGLLRSDWSRWKTFRQARTDSTHAYDEGKAQAVFEIAPDFLEEARYLFSQLNARNSNHD